MPLEIAHALTASRLTDLRARLAPLLQTTLPLTLEIGSGHGHFLTAYAEAHPGRFCIGIDLIGDRLERSARKSGFLRRCPRRPASPKFSFCFPTRGLSAATGKTACFNLSFSAPWRRGRRRALACVSAPTMRRISPKPAISRATMAIGALPSKNPGPSSSPRCFNSVRTDTSHL